MIQVRDAINEIASLTVFISFWWLLVISDTTEQQKVIGAWLCDYAEHQQQFDEIKHRHTLNEVGDVAESRYD